MIKTREIYVGGQVNRTEQYDDGVTAAEYLPAYRYKREVGGVSYLGKTIQTDRETRANWIGILINAQSDPAYTTPWKTADGSFVTYNAAEAIGAALAVSGHVQKCFLAEETVAESLSSYTTEAQIEEAFEEAYNV
jgi:hypothetical protein